MVPGHYLPPPQNGAPPVREKGAGTRGNDRCSEPSVATSEQPTERSDQWAGVSNASGSVSFGELPLSTLVSAANLPLYITDVTAKSDSPNPLLRRSVVAPRRVAPSNSGRVAPSMPLVVSLGGPPSVLRVPLRGLHFCPLGSAEALPPSPACGL